MKKVFILLLAVLCVGGLSLFVTTLPDSKVQTAKSCPFCDPAVIQSQEYYESPLSIVLYNYKPFFRGHSLIIPKRYVERFEDLSPEEIADMGETVKKVQKAFQKVYGANDYLLVVQNGKNAGQTVFYVHMHMLPREQESVVTKMKLWWAFLSRPFSAALPISQAELDKERGLLRAAMSE